METSTERERGTVFKVYRGARQELDLEMDWRQSKESRNQEQGLGLKWQKMLDARHFPVCGRLYASE